MTILTSRQNLALQRLRYVLSSVTTNRHTWASLYLPKTKSLPGAASNNARV